MGLCIYKDMYNKSFTYGWVGNLFHVFYSLFTNFLLFVTGVVLLLHEFFLTERKHFKFASQRNITDLNTKDLIL